MTIADNYTPLKQLGNGATVQFSPSPPWPMLDASYAQVFLQDVTTGVQTPVTQGVGANQYQIVLTATGWTVTFGTAPPNTSYVVIGRSTTKDQRTPYTTSQGFQGANEDFSFDKLTAMLQETANTFSRAIVAPLGEVGTLTLPVAAQRFGKFLAFDGAGNVVMASGSSGGVVISAAMTPVVQASTTAAALGLLGGISAATVAATYAPLASPAFTGNPTVPTQALTDNSTKAANTAWIKSLLAPVSNALIADVPITATNTYFTGPQVNVGTTGVFFAWGTLTFNAVSGADNFLVRLSDGTTKIASTVQNGVATAVVSASVSGFITNPVGNIRLTAACINNTNNKMVFNSSGDGLDCKLNVIRVG